MIKLKDVLQPGDEVFYRKPMESSRYANKDLNGLLDPQGRFRQHFLDFDMDTGKYIGTTLPSMDIVRVERNGEVIWKAEPMTAPTPTTNPRLLEGLSVNVVDGRLEITVGIDILKYAVRFRGPLDEKIVTDTKVFAEAIALELRREEEDGTTLVHRMLDKAATNAVENGCEGVKYPRA